ncbi:MAG: membrane dipeptidase [Rhodocyclaceae bacterium]|nr:membrane dipeptidase [Rhodocyclaceae bacterium]MCA3116139.1 membrane dipeptidase [Rhodocyclaceae bacterium]MCA3119578.1 membrane dipeptidase [Rhodocyclaceae bacterium]MCA3847832.1 membrane dipeptidase [Burkholderia sp.]
MPMTAQAALERAQRIHAEHVVIDSMAPHFITEWVMTPPMVELARALQAKGKKRSEIRGVMADYLLEHCATDPATREAYLSYWRRSGVTAGNITLFGGGRPGTAWEALVDNLGRAGRMIDALDGAVVRADGAADIERAHRDKRHAVIYNIQNAEPVGDQLDRVDTLYGLGMRSMQLTYNLRTRFGDGCLEKNDGGISRFGEALVDKLNRSRMMVDVSHASPRTAADAVAASTMPVVASHTAARAISGHARGLPDDVLRAIAARGGYIGLVILPTFLMPAGGDGRALKRGKPAGWGTLDTVIEHVQHIIDVVGEDHVGIGTDWGKPYYTAIEWAPAMTNEAASGFDWIGWRPQDNFDPNVQMVDMETWDKWHNLTAAMLERGMPESTVVKVVGGNFLRVFGEVCG